MANGLTPNPNKAESMYTLTELYAIEKRIEKALRFYRKGIKKLEAMQEKRVERELAEGKWDVPDEDKLLDTKDDTK